MCENELTIRGRGGVMSCLAAIRGEPNKDGPCYIDFERIAPTPANVDWYKWRVGTQKNNYEDAHWGVKWNAARSFLGNNATDKKAKIWFDTIWRPPEPIIVELSRQYPQLTFLLKYWEGEYGFKGVFEVRAEWVIRDRTYHYNGDRGGFPVPEYGTTCYIDSNGVCRPSKETQS